MVPRDGCRDRAGWRGWHNPLRSLACPDDGPQRPPDTRITERRDLQRRAWRLQVGVGSELPPRALLIVGTKTRQKTLRDLQIYNPVERIRHNRKHDLNFLLNDNVLYPDQQRIWKLAPSGKLPCP
jgi:hypothetical protein